MKKGKAKNVGGVEGGNDDLEVVVVIDVVVVCPGKGP